MVTEKSFCSAFRPNLNTKDYERALAVFHNYGSSLSDDVVNVMLWAVDLGKVEVVLETLEKHYNEHLQFQHPEARGQVVSSYGANQTEQMFIRLCEETLGLSPQA